MSWTFNPPPGWPAQPEGWQPPPGWAPDPSWPPAPPDWEFWVPARAGGPTPATVRASAAPPTVATDPVDPYDSYHPGSPGPAYPGSPGLAYATGGYPLPARQSWYRRWWVAGVAALAVLLVGCLAGTVAALLTE